MKRKTSGVVSVRPSLSERSCNVKARKGTETKVRRKAGKTLRIPKVSAQPLELHLVVTRASGDTERYKLGTAPHMVAAMEYRRRLTAVKLPKLWMRKIIWAKREVA